MEEINAHRILIGRSEMKISLERPTLRWEDNIKLSLKKGCHELDLIHLAMYTYNDGIFYIR